MNQRNLIFSCVSSSGIADYIALAEAKRLLVWLLRNALSPLVARHIK